MAAKLALASHTGWQPSEIGALGLRDWRDYLNLLPRHG